MVFKLPFLKNFRRGFATNSSSSHSFVYLKEPVPGAEDDSVVDVEDFGWNDFRLDRIKEKLFYVLSNYIGGNLWRTPSEEEISEAWLNYSDKFPELSREDFEAVLQTHVDHQSRWTIGEELARDPRVVVFGGNDNSDGSAERASVIRSGLVDWTLSEPLEEDIEHFSSSDEAAWAKIKQVAPWLFELREELEEESED